MVTQKNNGAAGWGQIAWPCSLTIARLRLSKYLCPANWPIFISKYQLKTPEGY